MPSDGRLELLAGSRHGANEELLALGHGFSRRMLAALLRSGLAAAQREVVKAGGKPVEVRRIRITAARQQAIGYQSSLFPQLARPQWEIPKQKGDSKAEKVRPGGRMMEALRGEAPGVITEN